MLDGLRQRLAALADQTTLAQQVTFAMGMVFMLSVATVAFLAANISGNAAVTRIEAAMKETAVIFAGRLEQEMRERLADLALLAASAQMRGLWEGDPARLRVALEELAQSMGHEAWIGFVRPDGTVTAATQGTHENKSLATEPWFSHALTEPTVQDLKKEAPPDTAELHRPGTLLALPVPLPGGRTAGALVAHLSLREEDRIRQSLVGRPPEDPDEVWVLSREGKMLMGPAPDSRPYSVADIKQFLAQKSGTIVDGSGTDAVLTGFAVADGDAHAPFIDWIVIARRPAAAAFEEAHFLARSILGIGLVVLILALLAATFIARRMATPLGRLTAVADQIGRRAESDNLPRVRGSREVIRLSGTLRALLRRVGAAEARISAQSAQYAKDIGELRTLADTDPLTGLLNRRAFNEATAHALGGHRQSDTVGVLMVDIDHFKQVNDTYGHATGDVVLAAVGRLISTLVRGDDKAARFGGEEFVVLSYDVSADALHALAERLRTGIADARIAAEGHELQITVSVGATLACDIDRDLDDVIERADMALYSAKRSGRNRTELQLALTRLSA